MGSIVRSTGYRVLHRPVEPAGIIGMWESALPTRPLIGIWLFASMLGSGKQAWWNKHECDTVWKNMKDAIRHGIDGVLKNIHSLVRPPVSSGTESFDSRRLTTHPVKATARGALYVGKQWLLLGGPL
jgi:hypothetical protein